MRKVFILILFVLLLSSQASCASAIQKQIYTLLRKYFTQKASIAIMANIHVETGATYNFKTKQIGGNGYGLFQFDFMKKYYFKYIDNKKLVGSAANQIGFVYETIYGSQKDLIGAANAKIIGSYMKDPQKTIQQLTQYFCVKYQKPSIPHLDRRKAAAEILSKDADLKA